MIAILMPQTKLNYWLEMHNNNTYSMDSIIALGGPWAYHPNPFTGDRQGPDPQLVLTGRMLHQAQWRLQLLHPTLRRDQEQDQQLQVQRVEDHRLFSKRGQDQERMWRDQIVLE